MVSRMLCKEEKTKKSFYYLARPRPCMPAYNRGVLCVCVVSICKTEGAAAEATRLFKSLEPPPPESMQGQLFF